MQREYKTRIWKMVPRRGKVCSYSHDSNLNDRGTQPDVAYHWSISLNDSLPCFRCSLNAVRGKKKRKDESVIANVIRIKLKKEVKTMGIIAALIIVAVFGVSLLVWFHYEDKHHSVSAE